VKKKCKDRREAAVKHYEKQQLLGDSSGFNDSFGDSGDDNESLLGDKSEACY
jgi:hypothetical protein